MPACNIDLNANLPNPPGPCDVATLKMGLGALGNGDVIFKRKFRWTFEIEYCCGEGGRHVPASFVKMGNRPQIDFEEIEINYLNGKMFIPGKGTWQPLSITYYDVAGLVAGSATAELLSWIASIYDITDTEDCIFMNSALGTYAGQAKLMLYDGCGNPLEAWVLKNVWPQSVNWGDLDMASSDECTIELTLRYQNAQYISFCPPGNIIRCGCPPCPAAPQPPAFSPPSGNGSQNSPSPFALR